MREHAHEGAREVARLLDRSEDSVRSFAARSRVSLRRKGSRRGILMGQPRGVSLRREIRETLIVDRHDELAAARAVLDAEAALCPRCGARPVRASRTGWCNVCNCEHLAMQHDELTRDAAALRELWAARTRRKAALDALDASEREKGGPALLEHEAACGLSG
jgi:hypothetical protein